MNSPINLKPKVHSIFLEFDNNCKPEQAFAALFRLVEITRLNGAYFYGSNLHEGTTLRIVMENSHHLQEIGHVLSNNSDFTAMLKKQNVEITGEKPSKDEIALGMVSGNKIRGDKKARAAAEKGLSLAVNDPAYAKNSDFEYDNCPSCGEDAKWQTYCPHCGKQKNKLSKGPKYFLAFVMALNIISLFTLLSYLYSFHNAATIETVGKAAIYATLFIDITRCGVYLLSVAAIFKFRLVGFWVYMGMRVFDIFLGIFNLAAYGQNSLASAIPMAILWFALSYIFLKKDVDYMV